MKDMPKAGDVVISLAGRDAGRAFIVLGRASEELVLLADGELRKAERPKRKKIRHLKGTNVSISSLRERLQAGGAVENYELRAQLAAYRQQEEG